MALLSAETRINRAMQELDGLSAASLVCLAQDRGIKISKGGLSEALSGVRDLPNDVATATLDLLSKLEGLVVASHPLPLSFKNPKKIAALLQDMESAPIDAPSLSDLIVAHEIVGGATIQKVAFERNVPVEDMSERICEIVVKMFRLNETLVHTIK